LLLNDYEFKVNEAMISPDFNQASVYRCSKKLGEHYNLTFQFYLNATHNFLSL